MSFLHILTHFIPCVSWKDGLLTANSTMSSKTKLPGFLILALLLTCSMALGQRLQFVKTVILRYRVLVRNEISGLLKGEPIDLLFRKTAQNESHGTTQ